jgi:hypothetical protein
MWKDRSKQFFVFGGAVSFFLVVGLMTARDAVLTIGWLLLLVIVPLIGGVLAALLQPPANWLWHKTHRKDVPAANQPNVTPRSGSQAGPSSREQYHSRERTGILCLVLGAPLALLATIGVFYEFHVATLVADAFSILLCIAGVRLIKGTPLAVTNIK